MYLPLCFEMLEKHPDEKTGNNIFVQRASAPPTLPSKHHFGWIEDVLNTEWTSYTQPRWLIEDFPGGEKELFEACEEYLDVLQKSTEALRRLLDQ